MNLIRCGLVQPRDRLIFALDVDDIDRAERLVNLLSAHVGTFKVGSQLYTNAGPMVLDLVTKHQAKTMALAGHPCLTPPPSCATEDLSI